MSALGAAVKLTYSAVKLQARMEAEEEERQRKWMADHPGQLPPGMPAITAENYPFERDENWRAYERNVEIPAGVDREAAMAKIRAKWFEAHIAPHVPKPAEGGAEEEPEQGMEERMLKDQDAMKVAKTLLPSLFIC
jgi:hypothetical protein